MYYTTLKQLRKAGACVDGYNKLVRHIQQRPFTKEDEQRDKHIRFAHTEVIGFKTIIDSNGLDDALWSLKACEQTQDLKRSERLFAVWCARQVQHLMTDHRSINALDVAERHANGLATDEELSAARDAARDAAWAAAWEAARDAARDAARAAAWDAAWDAAREAQKTKFIEMFCN